MVKSFPDFHKHSVWPENHFYRTQSGTLQVFYLMFLWISINTQDFYSWIVYTSNHFLGSESAVYFLLLLSHLWLSELSLSSPPLLCPPCSKQKHWDRRSAMLMHSMPSFHWSIHTEPRAWFFWPSSGKDSCCRTTACHLQCVALHLFPIPKYKRIGTSMSHQGCDFRPKDALILLHSVSRLLIPLFCNR